MVAITNTTTWRRKRNKIKPSSRCPPEAASVGASRPRGTIVNAPMRNTSGARLAERGLDKLEVRSYEGDYLHGPRDIDFHGSHRMLSASGRWETPLLGIWNNSRCVTHREICVTSS